MKFGNRDVTGLDLAAVALTVSMHSALAGTAACLENYCVVLGDLSGDGDGIPITYEEGNWDGAGVFLNLGGDGHHPVLGDWNGDGVTDPGIVRNGQWLLLSDFDASEFYVFGAYDAQTIPVTGDWDGDGIETQGRYKDGTWVLSNSTMSEAAQGTMPTFALEFGTAGSRPLAGDWNHDGITDFGFYDGVRITLAAGPVPQAVNSYSFEMESNGWPVSGHFEGNRGFIGLVKSLPPGELQPEGAIVLPQKDSPAGGSIIIIPLDVTNF